MHLRTKLADKLLVREYIKDTISEQYLPKIYGVWDDAVQRLNRWKNRNYADID